MKIGNEYEIKTKQGPSNLSRTELVVNSTATKPTTKSTESTTMSKKSAKS